MKPVSILLIFLMIFLPDLNAQTTPWQLKGKREGIPVYTRKVQGSPILEYKANVVLKVPINKAIALFEDEKQIPNWYYQCVHAELIKDEGPDNRIIYLILHLPWPVTARDFVFRRTRIKDKDGTISYSLKALPDQIPQVKNMIRVKTIESIWTFKPIDNNQTEIFFQQHTDPAGSVPVSIINQIAIQTPFYSLKNFRKLLVGDTKKDAK